MVLAYIKSTTKRFKVFVANRVRNIQELWPIYSVVTCVGDVDPEIKRDVKVQLVYDVLENIEKQVSNWCKLRRIISLVLLYLKKLLLKVHRKKDMVKMTASYETVPGTQSFLI